MPMAESTAIERWIRAQLLANATVSDYVNEAIYRTVTQGTPAPYVHYLPDPSRNSEENTLSGDRAVLERFYEVHVVAIDTGFEALEGVWSGIFTALHKQAVADTDPRFFCQYVDEVRRDDPNVGIGGQIYYYRGGIFRFLVTPEV